MKNNRPIAIIGGYDLIAQSFFSKIKVINKNSIFINLNNKIIKKNNVYNFKIFELKKIFLTLNKYRIIDLLLSEN